MLEMVAITVSFLTFLLCFFVFATFFIGLNPHLFSRKD